MDQFEQITVEIYTTFAFRQQAFVHGQMFQI